MTTASRSALIPLVQQLGVIRGRVTLASGKEADYYVDMRRVTLNGEAAPLVGDVMWDLVQDLDFDAVGGLTLGADPVAYAIMRAGRAAGRPVDCFVVRKAEKQHGMQRLIEGADVAGRRVLVVEDTSTTGGSALQAVQAVRAAGAAVVGVATVVDRSTGADAAIRAAGCEYRYALGLDDLGLQPQ